jgi:nucleoside 2-deoxyribosyltransferase
MKLYLAGGLFNAAERLHNLYLEKHLKPFGLEVILPQREALKFFDGQKFDVAGIVSECRSMCVDNENLYVGSIDGADADSGTAVEYGISITTTGHAIIYRTDFRTALDRELGVNAMFTVEGTKFIYEPCYFTDLNEVDAYYERLALEIFLAVKNYITMQEE